MEQSEVSRLILETLQPGWNQSKATAEQLMAICARQQDMLSKGRTSWITSPSTGEVLDDYSLD